MSRRLQECRWKWKIFLAIRLKFMDAFNAKLDGK